MEGFRLTLSMELGFSIFCTILCRCSFMQFIKTCTVHVATIAYTAIVRHLYWFCTMYLYKWSKAEVFNLSPNYLLYMEAFTFSVDGNQLYTLAWLG